MSEPRAFTSGDELYAMVTARLADGGVMLLSTHIRTYTIDSVDAVRLHNGSCYFRWNRRWYPFSVGGAWCMAMRFGRYA